MSDDVLDIKGGDENEDEVLEDDTVSDFLGEDDMFEEEEDDLEIEEDPFDDKDDL